MIRITTPRVIAATALAATLALGGTATAFAAWGNGCRPCERPYAAACQSLRSACAGLGCGAGQGYVDADGDSVCDKWQEGTGLGCGTGQGYVDANGDGVCDNWQPGQGQGYGQGAGNGAHHGRGHGRC